MPFFLINRARSCSPKNVLYQQVIMNNKALNILLILSLFFLSFVKLSAQDNPSYIQLEDASGWDTSTPRSSLEAAAQTLIENLPPAVQDSFRVFDFGFYLLQNNFSGGLPAAFQQKIEEVNSLSPYYLLFGKQSGTNGVYTKFWLELKLPGAESYPCLTADAFEYVRLLTTNHLQSIYDDLGKEPVYYHQAEIAAMELLGRKLYKLMNCCQIAKSGNNRKSLETCENTYDVDELAAFLQSVGVNAVAYCKICEGTDTPNNASSVSTFVDGQQKIRCIFANLKEDNTFEQLFFDPALALSSENVPSDVPSFQDFGEDEDLILVYRSDGLKQCPAYSVYPDLCDADSDANTNVDILDYEFGLKKDIGSCLLEESSLLFLNGFSEKKITKSQLDIYTGELKNWLSAADYDGVYYIFDPVNVTLQLITRNQSPELITNRLEIAKHLADYRNKDFLDNAQFGMWAEYENGNLKVNIDFATSYVTPNPLYNLGGKSENDYATLLKEIVYGKLNQMISFDESVYQVSNESGELVHDGELAVKTASVFKFIGFTLEEVSHVIRQAELDKHFWSDEDPAKYNAKLVNMFAPVAGGLDQTLVEVKDLYDFTQFMKQFIHKPAETAKGIYQSVAALDYDKLVSMLGEAAESEREKFLTEGRERQYHTTRRGIQVCTIIFFAVKEGPKIALEFVNTTGDFLQRMKEFIGNFDSAELGNKLAESSQEFRTKFFETFETNVYQVKDYFNNHPSLLDVWGKLDDVVGKDTENMSKISNYFDEFGATGDLLDVPNVMFEQPKIQQQWIDDLVSLNTPYPDMGDVVYLTEYVNRNITPLIDEISGTPAAGSFKSAFNIEGSSEKVLVRLKIDKENPTDYKELIQEINWLADLKSQSILTVEIDGILKHRGIASYVLKKHRVSIKIPSQIKDLPDDLVTVNGVGDLFVLGKKMKDKRIQIDDLQYLISNEGHFLVADPLGVKIGNGATYVDDIINYDLIPMLNNMLTRLLPKKLQSGVIYTKIDILNLLENKIDEDFLTSYISKPNSAIIVEGGDTD